MSEPSSISIDNITVTKLGCHEKCVIFEGGKHSPEVNPCGHTNPVEWRLECSGCGTVLKIFMTYDAAIQAGKEHAVDPSMHYPFDDGPYDDEGETK